MAGERLDSPAISECCYPRFGRAYGSRLRLHFLVASLAVGIADCTGFSGTWIALVSGLVQIVLAFAPTAAPLSAAMIGPAAMTGRRLG